MSEDDVKYATYIYLCRSYTNLKCLNIKINDNQQIDSTASIHKIFCTESRMFFLEAWLILWEASKCIGKSMIVLSDDN